MRVAVLTSSRADYGIYIPLLQRLKEDDFFQLKIIAFGTHLSRYHGYTIDQIREDGFEVEEQIESLILGDTKEAISNAIGNTITKFSSLWQRLENEVDVLIALGDRYEMFAAVTAAIPFNIRVAHLHGGETTLGAIDNTFRHAITLMSSLHFVSISPYAQKVSELIGSTQNIFEVGALSLDGISSLPLYGKEEFLEKYNIDVSIPTILTTFHPETVSAEKNIDFTDTLVEVFGHLSSRYQIVITMPNADTMGSIIREKFNQLIQENERVIGIENFGKIGYFSCMKYCAFLLGNTSSGIMEAASFNNYVINLGDRQKGRIRGENVIDVPIEKDKIISAVKYIESEGTIYRGENMFKKSGECSEEIIKNLKRIHQQATTIGSQD